MKEKIGVINSDGKKQIMEKAIEIIDCRSIKVIDLLIDIGKQINGISDSLFWNAFKEYILSLIEYNSYKGSCKEDNLRKFSEALAEAIPNQEANYDGNKDVLRDYYIRLLW